MEFVIVDKSHDVYGVEMPHRGLYELSHTERGFAYVVSDGEVFTVDESDLIDATHDNRFKYAVRNLLGVEVEKLECVDSFTVKHPHLSPFDVEELIKLKRTIEPPRLRVETVRLDAVADGKGYIAHVGVCTCGLAFVHFDANKLPSVNGR